MRCPEHQHADYQDISHEAMLLVQAKVAGFRTGKSQAKAAAFMSVSFSTPANEVGLCQILSFTWQHKPSTVPSKSSGRTPSGLLGTPMHSG